MAARARNRRRLDLPRESRAEELYQTKQLYTDYFGQLRKGSASGYDPNRRANIIDDIVVPKHGRWRGMQDPYKSARPPAMYRSRAIFAAAIPQTPGRLAPQDRAKLQDAYSATFRLNRNFAPAHVTFRKILGYGGFGVAALFGLHDSTGRENTVVVKADLRPRAGASVGIKTEKQHMILMAGAKHVVQRLLLIEFPWPKDIPIRYDYVLAAGRLIIKLHIFLIKVMFLLLVTAIHVIIWLVGTLMDWILWILGVRIEAIYGDDDPNVADNQDPQPVAAQPGLSRPDPSRARPAQPARAPPMSAVGQPGPSFPDPSRPRPGPSRSTASRPAPAQPARAQPAAAQPAAAEPDPVGPDPQPEPSRSLNPWYLVRRLWPKWPAAPPRALGIDGAIRKNRMELDARDDVISMEFLKFGDLGKWIGKMATQNNYDPESVFPERVAWVVFECLWRGCVAMAYPTGFYQGKNPMNTQIPQMTESMEASTVGGGDPLVHFDLDPQNSINDSAPVLIVVHLSDMSVFIVFVGDFAADHQLWPLTKIGDLGLSLQPKSQTYADDIDQESKLWLRRRRGKRDSLLPEQMTEEWDYIPDLDALLSHEVASNYSTHSNIYHIGLAMFELMTLNLPDEPPFARPYSFRIDRQSLTGWTYGHNLLSENNPGLVEQFSAELRNTVAWCMEHNPNDRPSLGRLGQIVERNTAGEFLAQTDDATKTSVGNFIGTPLPPTRNDKPRGRVDIFKRGVL